MTDFFKDKTPLWSPEQIKELESEWNPVDSKLIAEELPPQQYKEWMRKYPKRYSYPMDFKDWTFMQVVKFQRCRKMERQNMLKSQGKWYAEYGPTPWDLKMPPGLATPWEKDL